MAFHEVALGRVEWAGLAEYPRIHVDLAHVVEHPGQGEAIEIVLAQPESASEIHGEVGDAVNVPVQIFDDIFHHLDQVMVGKVFHTVAHPDSFVGTSQIVDKSSVSFARMASWMLPAVSSRSI
jgi:hypothetical protein